MLSGCLIGKCTRSNSFERAMDIQVTSGDGRDSAGRKDWLLFARASVMNLAAGTRKPATLRQGGNDGCKLASCLNPADFCPFVPRQSS